MVYIPEEIAEGETFNSAPLTQVKAVDGDAVVTATSMENPSGGSLSNRRIIEGDTTPCGVWYSSVTVVTGTVEGLASTERTPKAYNA